jgi:hypothetical protein
MALFHRLLLASALLMLAGAGYRSMPRRGHPSGTIGSVTAAVLADWEAVYSVLSHPRCINCHTATEYPQQGDDRHRHLFNIVRGPESRGVPGLRCATCHQDGNSDPTGVPGGPHWHLAPLSMAWQDEQDRILSSGEVCRRLTDPARARIEPKALVEHHATEPLVAWAWQPGLRADGTPRIPPPITRAQFVAATRRWVTAGAPCPPA